MCASVAIVWRTRSQSVRLPGTGKALPFSSRGGSKGDDTDVDSSLDVDEGEAASQELDDDSGLLHILLTCAP